MRALRVLFLVAGVALGLILPFISVLLQTRGFDPATIGLVAAVAGVFYTAAVPIWGHLGDVTLGRARAFQVAAIGSGVVMVAFVLPLPGLLLAAIVVGWYIFESAYAPLADSLAIGLLPDPGRQFGRIRLLTSLSFALTAIAIGFVYDGIGYGMIPLLWALGAAATAVVLAPLARIPQAREARRAGTRGGSIGTALAVQPRLRRILVAVALVYLAISASSTFLALRLVALGGQPSDLAFSSGLGALMEVPGMLVATWAARRIGLRALFGISAAMYCICVISWSIIDVPAVIIATRLVSGAAFAGLWIACVLTIGVLLPSPLQASGQALYQTVASGVAAVLGNTIGGVIYAQIGPGLFAVVGLLGLLGVLAGWLTLPARAESRDGLGLRAPVPAEAAGPA